MAQRNHSFNFLKNVIGQPKMFNEINELYQNKNKWCYIARLFITILNINRN